MPFLSMCHVHLTSCLMLMKRVSTPGSMCQYNCHIGIDVWRRYKHGNKPNSRGYNTTGVLTMNNETLLQVSEY